MVFGGTIGVILLTQLAATTPVGYAIYDLEDAVKSLANESEACRTVAGRTSRVLLAKFKEAESAPLGERALEESIKTCGQAAILAEKQCTLVLRRALRSAWLNLEKIGEPAGASKTTVSSNAKEPPSSDDGMCWDPADKGCLYTRNEQRAANPETWKNLNRAVQAKMPQLMSMRDVIKERFGRGIYITMKQLDILLAYFAGHAFMMLEVVEAAAVRVVNPQDTDDLTTSFDSDFNHSKALRVLASQPTGKKSWAKSTK
jgi:hypothetical protein